MVASHSTDRFGVASWSPHDRGRLDLATIGHGYIMWPPTPWHTN